MTFLNPLLLFGLVAAAIPVILHLLNLRKLRTVEFSTLAFLKELQQTKIRRLKLRQLLLLILRTLLVMAIVVAFARPALKGTMFAGLGSHASTTMVLILDDSFSMGAGDEHGERFRQAKDAMENIITMLKEGDEAYLIRLSELPRVSIEPATHDLAVLRAAVRESKLSAVRHTVEDALKISARLLHATGNANREIYIISDFQKTILSDQLRRLPVAAPPLLPGDIHLFLMPTGSKGIPNIGLDSLGILTTIVQTNLPIHLSVGIRNFGAVAVSDYVASVFIDGMRVAQTNVNLEPWGSAIRDVVITPKHAGIIRGYVELEQDAIEQDNRRFFTLTIPESTAVATVSGTHNASLYPLLALRAGSPDGRHALFTVKEATPATFPLLPLQNEDVLILSDVAELPSGDLQRIARFVGQGGGLIIFPGSSVQADRFNATFGSAWKLPTLRGPVSAPGTDAVFSFAKVDLDHPLFSSIFDQNTMPSRQANRTGVESPAIRTTFSLKSPAGGRTIIALSNGGAFLTEHRLENGKILTFSIPPTNAWSDFPLKALFAPLIVRSVLYLSAGGEAAFSQTAGEEALIDLSSRAALGHRATPNAEEQYSLVYPDGQRELIKPIDRLSTTGRLSFKTGRLAEPGIYTIDRGSDPIASIAVNTDIRESDTRPAGGEDLDLLWQNLGIQPAVVHTAPAADELQSTILQSRFGVELWKYFLVLAIMLALIEMLIARDSRKNLAQYPTG